MKVIRCNNVGVRVEMVKELIQSAGDKLFAVTFIKRSDGSKRKMVCRRKVRKPSYAKSPSGKISYKRRERDERNNLMTVFDCNHLMYNKKDKLSGRGGWKSLPLDSIIRLKVNGEIYKVMVSEK